MRWRNACISTIIDDKVGMDHRKPKEREKKKSLLCPHHHAQQRKRLGRAILYSTKKILPIYCTWTWLEDWLGSSEWKHIQKDKVIVNQMLDVWLKSIFEQTITGLDYQW